MSDSIPNVSINVASSNPKDFSKKKRANRSAKLKQCKLDVRREQWLSQVKKKSGCKEEVNSGGTASKVSPLHSENGRGKPVENLEVKTRNEDEIYGNGTSVHRYSDSESLPSNSPTSHTSSVLCSSVNFTASSRSSSSSGRSSSSSSIGFCSGHMSDEDGGGDAIDDDDGCLDDWEAVADALEAKDKKQQDCSPKVAYGGSLTPKTKHENAAEVDNISTATLESGGKEGPIISAWRPDDAYRPQSLPNLAKQCSFPLNSERHVGRGSVCGCKNIAPIPTSCPICFEDFDCTDSSFLPCSCGFRLCLFCHKRILEEDGRCPGCRKKYEGEPTIEGEATLDGGRLTFRLARSCSMISRS